MGKEPPDEDPEHRQPETVVLPVLDRAPVREQDGDGAQRGHADREAPPGALLEQGHGSVRHLHPLLRRQLRVAGPGPHEQKDADHRQRDHGSQQGDHPVGLHRKLLFAVRDGLRA
jgi:hypothetical protein